MFQYAAGKSLSVKYNTPLHLDDSFLALIDKNVTPRTFELGIFGLHTTRPSQWLLRGLYSSGRKRRLDQFLCSRKITLFQQQHFAYELLFEQQQSQVYLDGYWQSERYFEGIKTIIREKFNFPSLTLAEDIELLEAIKRSNSVSVHIRCGDYLISDQANKRHGHLPIRYYQEAIQRLKSLPDPPCFFIFSDDPGWVRTYLPELSAEGQLVGRSSSGDWTHMYLMSKCKYHIIANSSFSWWAAWLGTYCNKQVIAPINWFREPPAGFLLSDLLPPEWIKL
jgi:hypothetical protein